MRKIKCDVCGKEVVTSDPNEMPWSGYQFNEVSMLKRQVEPKSVDLCYDCSITVWNKIQDLKTEKHMKEALIPTSGQEAQILLPGPIPQKRQVGHPEPDEDV